MSGLRGMDRFQRNLLAMVAAGKLKRMTDDATAVVLKEAKKRVPRKTGLLESEVQAVPAAMEGGVAVGRVGVPEGSAALPQAKATERTGSHNYTIGTPERPKTRWQTKSKVGATMPWLSVSLIRSKKRMVDAMARRLLR